MQKAPLGGMPSGYRTRHRDPVFTIVDQQCQQRAQVQGDIEGETRILPFEEPRDENEMGGTGDWKELGQALYGTQNYRLKV